MMQKRWMIVLVLLAIVVLSVPLASAQMEVDPATLAGEFPADETVIFASSRVDSAFVNELDRILAPFYPYVDDLPAGFTLETGLDLALAEAEIEGTFDEVVRPWLGNTVALGAFIDEDVFEDTEFLYTDAVFDSMEPIIAAEITNRAEAQAFIELLMESEGMTPEPDEEGRYTVYEIPFGPLVVLDDDTLLIGEENTLEMLSLLDSDFNTLADDAIFNTMRGALPSGTYNGLVYANVPVIRGAIERVAQESENTVGAQEAADTVTVIDTFGFGGVAAGFGLLKGDTLAVDAVIIDAADYLSSVNIGSIDPAFAEFIPVETPFVIHGTNLAGTYEALLGILPRLAEVDPDVDMQEFEDGLAELNTTLQAEVGLTVDDLIGWMQSDYALTLGLTDSAQQATSIFGLIGANPAETGFLVDASADPDAALAVVDAIEELLASELVGELTDGEDATVDITLEREADVVTLTLRDQTAQLPFPVTLQTGVSDDVFFIGTAGISNSVLAGDGGLGSTEVFVDATNVLLSDAYSLYFISVEGLTPLLSIIEGVADESDQADIETVRGVLELFRHLTISQAIDAENNSISRATITLNLN